LIHPYFPTHSFDFAWFRSHVLEDILPRWLESSVTEAGLFLPHLDRQWHQRGKNYGTIVSQSRLLYNFAKGLELTGEEDYRRAVETGARFLLGNFWDGECGGWVWSCSLDGDILDPKKSSYGHAFAILGLSHAFHATGDGDLKRAALDTWEILNAHFKDPHGGIKNEMSRDFTESADFNSQNPVMHLFEALLALADQEGMDHMFAEAEQIADFVLSRLVRKQDGMLPEVYDLDWRELPADENGRIDIGHAFEWSFLLSHAVGKGLPETYLSRASELLEYGLRIGYDPEDGGILSPASPEGQITSSSTKGWWEQCEAARALLHFAVCRQRDDLWQPLQKTVDFFKERFVDEECGGWYTAGEGDASRLDKGSEWKVDYHVVGMCLEAMRLEPGVS